MLRSEKIEKIYFMLLFLGVLSLTVYIFLPFAMVLLLATVAAIMLRPVHTKMVHRFKKPLLASFGSLIILGFVVFLPIIFLTNVLIGESQSVYQSITQGQGQNTLSKVSGELNQVLARFDPNSSIDLGAYFAGGINWFVKNVGSVVISGTASLFLQIFLLFVITFFFLKYGHVFSRFLKDLSPLDEHYDNKIFASITSAVQSIVKGVFLIAIIQGTLTGIGLWIFGLPNPLFWGAVAAICAPIPLIGTGAVLVPSVIYLALTGSGLAALLLTLWGVLLVGFVDNLIAPYIYSQGIEVHQLPMLLSVLGGLSVFGVLGFIIGPIILAVCISLIDIYRELILKENPHS
jgi:predicted PurR-regulated permease PerM